MLHITHTFNHHLAKFIRLTLLATTLSGIGTGTPLTYAPAPSDNPMRGLVPYITAAQKENFPHSMEFSYFSLKDLLKGPNQYHWHPIEQALETAQKRGNQLIFRIYCEYPGEKSNIPQYLLDAGVNVTKWTNKSGNQISHTPDYENPILRRELVAFIHAMGAKYNDDPRIAFITAGILGSWGEWHNYPRNDLWASKQTQREILKAYTKAFTKTKILLRYPAGPSSENYVDNHNLPYGYHDDSFSWSTISTGENNNPWHFEPTLIKAGASNKWKQFPIGGEIRPELWKQIFTPNLHPKDQGFITCVQRMHTSWLMDSGMFAPQYPTNKQRKLTALKQVAKMGYELHLSDIERKDGKLILTIKNLGVAPFYYDWPVDVEINGKLKPNDWKLNNILPGKPHTWIIDASEKNTVKIRIPNPMKGGKSLRFANRDQGKEWLTIP